MKSSRMGWNAGVMALALGLAARADTVYVSLQGSEANTGKGGWANAVASISNGVARAANYDTVLVSNGTYTLTTQVSLNKTGLTLKGFEGRDHTILNGNYPATSNKCIFITANSVVLDGLTISNGCAAAGGSGGGVGANTHSGLVIRNCTFANNRAENWGGGMYLPHGVVSNCVFRNNFAQNQGGGLKHINYDSWGTGRLVDCLFDGNTVGSVPYGSNYGGGGAGAMVTAVDVANCMFVSNTAPYAMYGYGGGLFKAGTGSVRNCLITGNESFYGGGLYTYAKVDAIDNCTIAYNKAYTAGGLHLKTSGSTLHNTIVISNNATGTAYHNIYNDTKVETTFLHCNAAPLIVPGPYGAGTNSPACANNINADPRFVSAMAGDFRLMPRSPCLNTGTNQAWMAGAIDLYGNPRRDKFYAQVDIGCHEYVYRNGTILTLR